MKVQAHGFRTMTGIQTRPDAFDETRFIMTFFTILGFTKILSSFILILEEKAGIGIPRLEFLGLEVFNHSSRTRLFPDVVFAEKLENH